MARSKTDPKAMIGIFIGLAIGVLVVLNLMPTVYMQINATAQPLLKYGNSIATASITLAYLVGFVMIAGVIVYIVKVVIG